MDDTNNGINNQPTCVTGNACQMSRIDFAVANGQMLPFVAFLGVDNEKMEYPESFLKNNLYFWKKLLPKWNYF